MYKQRYQGEVSASQGMSEMASKPPEARRDFSSQFSEGIKPADTIISDF